MTLVGLIFASSIMNNGENLPFEELKSALRRFVDSSYASFL
jgi:hypothetical protein